MNGISNTFYIVPKPLGPTSEERVDNLVTMMDGYFSKEAHHLNANVLNREMLEDAWSILRIILSSPSVCRGMR